MTDEKILKKIGKLLSLYGVDEEEKAKFLADVQDAKYDDDEEEVVEEVVEKDEVPATDETPDVEQEEEVIDEELPTDEVVEEEQPVVEEEKETEVDYKAKYEELKGVIDGLVARIEPLENIVAKLGVPEKDESFGVEPQAESEKDEALSYFDELNRKRTGRN